MEKYSPNNSSGRSSRRRREPERERPLPEHGKCLVMSRDEVRAFDSWAINTLGIPGVVLMENAGRSCAELIKEKLMDLAMPAVRHPVDYGSKVTKPKVCPVPSRYRVCIFCGTGNNGGDGFVIARHLLNTHLGVRFEARPRQRWVGASRRRSSYKVTVVICGERNKIKGDAKINLDILERMGQPIEQLNLNESNISGKIKLFAAGADMLVDSLFGTGLTGQLSDQFKQLIESMNSQNCPILAVDIPSGLDCDTGQPLGAVIKANYTVTFVAVKKGFTFPGAARYTGEIFVASIGVEPNSYPGI